MWRIIYFFSLVPKPIRPRLLSPHLPCNGVLLYACERFVPRRRPSPRRRGAMRYRAWWEQVAQVEVLDTQVQERQPQAVVIRATVRYMMRSGTVTEERHRFHLGHRSDDPALAHCRPDAWGAAAPSPVSEHGSGDRPTNPSKKNNLMARSTAPTC